MDKVINLTPQPITASAVGKQDITSSLDISDLDVLDLQMGVVAISGSQSSSIEIALITSMQADVDDSSWIQTSFPTFAAGPYPKWGFNSFTMGLLRYVRWSVISLGGCTSVTFSIRGVGRTLC